MISLMDQDVGKIIRLLKKLKIENNTLVIFTSDNGAHNAGGIIPDFFNDSGPLRGIKRDLYEGGIRVPFVAYWPSVIEPSRRSGHLAAHWDLMATACDIAGLKLHDGTNSVSYLPLLKGTLDRQKAHDFLYFELHWPTKRSARKGQWVAVQKHTSSVDPSVNEIELYNLENDLSQKFNVAEQFPEKVAEFKEIFLASHKQSEHFVFGQKRPQKARIKW
jgi:arylsulfatase A-like enzyme